MCVLVIQYTHTHTHTYYILYGTNNPSATTSSGTPGPWFLASGNSELKADVYQLQAR